MTAREAAREEWRKLKNKPLKDKLVHIGTYYWPHILVGGFLLILAVSTIVTIATAKEPALQVYLVSTARNDTAAEDPALAFARFAGIDPEEYEVSLAVSSFGASGSADMTLADSQIIGSQTAAEALDVLCGDVAALLDYAYGDYFYDLRQLLSQEQLESWAPHLLYIDRVVYDRINEGTETAYALPDPTRPEDMEDPIPVALSIPDSSVLWNSCTFMGDTPAAGVVINTQQPENAQRFLEYIMQ